MTTKRLLNPITVVTNSDLFEIANLIRNDMLWRKLKKNCNNKSTVRTDVLAQRIQFQVDQHNDVHVFVKFND